MGEFKKFVLRGNVLELAVGVIVGGAFQVIVNSLVNDVMMPVVSLFTRGVDFSDWYIVLGAVERMTREEAQKLGLPIVSYGNFIAAVVNFFIMAFVVFLIVKAINRVMDAGKKEEAPAAPTTKKCVYCKSEINIKATRCPNCTSELDSEETEEAEEPEVKNSEK
ncbi:MAG: large conductance mechanosensitive channel protein MscL [Oscillospiraceae bacterium]|nr:large conductance mechanosensitive channel protein MscL [Oscillospiraceae bacterium]